MAKDGSITKNEGVRRMKQLVAQKKTRGGTKTTIRGMTNKRGGDIKEKERRKDDRNKGRREVKKGRSITNNWRQGSKKNNSAIDIGVRIETKKRDECRRKPKKNEGSTDLIIDDNTRHKNYVFKK